MLYEVQVVMPVKLVYSIENSTLKLQKLCGVNLPLGLEDQNNNTDMLFRSIKPQEGINVRLNLICDFVLTTIPTACNAHVCWKFKKVYLLTCI